MVTMRQKRVSFNSRCLGQFWKAEVGNFSRAPKPVSLNLKGDVLKPVIPLDLKGNRRTGFQVIDRLAKKRQVRYRLIVDRVDHVILSQINQL
jgi:hypothetical protein